MRHRQRALTLVELLVAVAVLVVIAMMAVPSFRDFVLLQRLKSVNSQLVTDLQFGRAEAVTRNALLRTSFRSDDNMTCYTLYVTKTVDNASANGQRCACRLGVGSACPDSTGMWEVRTLQVQRSLAVQMAIPADQTSAFAFDPVTGGLMAIPQDNPTTPMNLFRINTSIDSARALGTVLNRAGRPTVCVPSGSSMAGAACP